MESVMRTLFIIFILSFLVSYDNTAKATDADSHLRSIFTRNYDGACRYAEPITGRHRDHPAKYIFFGINPDDIYITNLTIEKEFPVEILHEKGKIQIIDTDTMSDKIENRSDSDITDSYNILLNTVKQHSLTIVNGVTKTKARTIRMGANINIPLGSLTSAFSGQKTVAITTVYNNSTTRVEMINESKTISRTINIKVKPMTTSYIGAKLQQFKYVVPFEQKILLNGILEPEPPKKYLKNCTIGNTKLKKLAYGPFNINTSLSNILSESERTITIKGTISILDGSSFDYKVIEKKINETEISSKYVMPSEEIFKVSNDILRTKQQSNSSEENFGKLNFRQDSFLGSDFIVSSEGLIGKEAMASGTHQCQSHTDIGHTCQVIGTAGNCDQVAESLKLDDCCSLTEICTFDNDGNRVCKLGGSSIGFTMDYCIP